MFWSNNREKELKKTVIDLENLITELKRENEILKQNQKKRPGRRRKEVK